MLNNETVGKGRFADLQSKYKEAIVTNPEPETISSPSVPVEAIVSIPDLAQETARPVVEESKPLVGRVIPRPATRVTRRADELRDEVEKSADQSIKKRRHPAFKGERIPRTYMVHTEIVDWMNRVYEAEGVEIQAQVGKALREWLEKYYAKHKV